ncbi:MAG: YdjY domain-containing protein [Planctomycetaceae bacterium]
MKTRLRFAGFCFAVLMGLGSGILATAQEKAAAPKEEAKEAKAKVDFEAIGKIALAATKEGNPDLIRLAPKHDVFLDKKNKVIVVDGAVCLREGQLEMFACPKGTKEHESVVALNCVAEQVHAGLLAVGAKPGTPVSFNPKYQAASGDIVDIFVVWSDEKGNIKHVRAQDWVQYVKTKKAMEYDWVFAGSGFWEDEETKVKHYQANSGDFICVSNFPTATLDLPVESSQANSNLLFHAFTENIPAKGTKIRLVLIPRRSKEGAAAPAAPAKDEKSAKEKAR